MNKKVKSRSEYKPVEYGRFDRWRPNTRWATGTRADYLIYEKKRPDFRMTILLVVVMTFLITRLFIPPKVQPPIEEVIVEEVIIEEEEPVKEYKSIIMHTGFDPFDPRQEMVRYAYAIGGMDLVILQECENWQRTPDRDEYGHRGLCQFNKIHQAKIIGEPQFEDWKFQLLKCQELYETGTPFYWPDRILPETGKKCWDSVEDRFIFVETEIDETDNGTDEEATPTDEGLQGEISDAE